MADRVTVIGWDGSPLSGTARAALDAATLVVAAPYHVDRLGLPPGAERLPLGSVERAARRIADHRGAAVVVTEGDPGFFGVVRTLRRPEFGLELEVLPAVSSAAAAFARAGMPWDDARVVSAHGRGLRRAANVCRAHPKVAVLTAPGAGPTELALMLRDVHRTFVVCEALGTPEEQVTVLTSDRIADHVWRDPNVVLVVGGHARTSSVAAAGWIAGYAVDFPRGRGWALDDAAYGAPGPSAGAPAVGTDEKPDPSDTSLPPAARALALAWLGPRPGDLLWDVGAGSGGLAVEAARFGAAVVAVDRDAAACARIAVNARRFGVEVDVVHGEAPEVLGGLPEPDVVAVQYATAGIVGACLARRPERVVAVPRTFQEADAVRRVLAEVGYRIEGTLLQASALLTVPGPAAGATPAARGHGLGPAVPVILLRGQRATD